MTLSLVYKTVSSLHAEIVETESGLVLRDLGSTNGTFVQAAGEEDAFVRRDSLQIKGAGLIGLGRLPDDVSPQTIRFDCEEG